MTTSGKTETTDLAAVNQCFAEANKEGFWSDIEDPNASPRSSGRPAGYSRNSWGSIRARSTAQSSLIPLTHEMPISG
jgi:hypothetical protein